LFNIDKTRCVSRARGEIQDPKGALPNKEFENTGNDPEYVVRRLARVTTFVWVTLLRLVNWVCSANSI
jgi:hypothetical protein